MLETKTKNKKVPFKESFIKSQVSSILATAVDFLVLSFCTEILTIFYVFSTAIGSAAGAIVSFFLGRNWAFRRKNGQLSYQALKYLFVSSASLFLNTNGVFLLTEYVGFHYLISKLIISLMVGIFFNFFMFRYFVYK